MNIIVSFLLFVLVIMVVVIIHEGGHFWVGRLCGVAVKKFSVGFGPVLWSYSSSSGCLFVLSALPLGGYVEFAEDAPSFPRAKRKRSFYNFSLSLISPDKTLANTPPLGRICIAFAGPFANILLAWLLLTGSFFFQGHAINNTPDAVVGTLTEISPAREGGMLVGDKILAIDGQLVEDFQHLVDIFKTYPPRSTVAFLIVRGQQQEQKTLSITLGDKDAHAYLGIMPLESAKADLSLATSTYYAVGQIVFITKRTAEYLYGAFQQKSDLSDLAGPLGIAQIAGQVYESGGFSRLHALCSNTFFRSWAF